MTLPPRLFVAENFAAQAVIALPGPASRHVQVLRLQPADSLTLFNGDGTEWPAEIVRIGRREVEVRLGAAPARVHRELACDVTLALGVPANDRMDALVEKASELGAAAIQPLVCERSVLRLSGERAELRRAHWQAVAAAASEQCGRTKVTKVMPMRSLAGWLDDAQRLPGRCLVVLSLAASARAPAQAFGFDAEVPARGEAIVLSGPEGGLSAAEEDAALAAGFEAVSLGPRTLRADTAPLALLAWLALRATTTPPGAN